MKQVPRPVLIALLCAGLTMALWPVGQWSYGWWMQHNLQNNWHDAVAEYQAAHPHVTQRRWTRTHARIRRTTKPSSPHTRRLAFNAAAPTPKPVTHLDPPLPTASYLDTSATGWPPTRLVIPDIGLDAVVVEGIDPTALSQGPGHDPISALPGESGNCVIAGHRNMYGWWFYKLNRLAARSTIQLRSPLGNFTYQVAKISVVPDTDIEVLDPPPLGTAPRLTLYTCALPHGSKRIVVVANLIGQKPL